MDLEFDNMPMQGAIIKVIGVGGAGGCTYRGCEPLCAARGCGG